MSHLVYMFIVQSLFLIFLFGVSIIFPIIGMITNKYSTPWLDRPTFLSFSSMTAWIITPIYTFAYIVSFLPDFLLKMGYLVKP